MVADRWTYRWDHPRKPHIHPVCTPAGGCLTRAEPPDHPWHRGLWFTIKFVNEENFWEEYGEYGVLRHVTEPSTTEVDGTTVVDGSLDWIGADRPTAVIREQRRIVHVPVDEHAYALDFSTSLVPETDVLLDRTPFDTWGGYGGLTLRGAPDWSDTRLLLADGSMHERVHGVPSAWCDLSGPAGGIAWLDAPTNPRHPVPWYGSTRAPTYGDEGWSNFLNAAFLWDEPLPVAAGEPLSFSYRLVVHDGMWDAPRIAAAYSTWPGRSA